MKQDPDPTADSLISGMSPQSQVPQTPIENSSVFSNPPQPVQTDPNFSTGVQTPSYSPSVATPPTSFASPNPQPMQENPSPYQPVQPVDTNLSGPAFTSQPQPMTTPFPQPVAPMTAQPVAPPQPNPQTTSPFDTPPAPQIPVQPAQNPVNLGTAVVEEKPKKKMPTFLLLLLLLVIIVLGAVGFLAYQNYNLNKNIEEPVSNKPSLSVPTTTKTDPYLGYSSYTGKIIPISYKIPSDWKTEEVEDPELGNQKMIKSNSSDFSYEGSEIANGFEFRVGPINDLTKKYDSFDAFAAEENAGNIYTAKDINGMKWLVKETEAKTLFNNSPITIALYSSKKQAVTAKETFSNILDSFKFTTPVLPAKQEASPSATAQ